LCKISQILNSVIPVLIALGVVYFVWGVVQYVIASDEEAKKTGRNRIIYGIIGLAVIVAMWGLVGILTRTFNVDNSGVITLPTINNF
jgi:ABC-type thiamin/hydroxymethylpyrimidine transport system permease subunit